MKTTIAILICAALTAAPLQAQDTNSPPTTDVTLCEVMLVLGCTVLAGAYVVWVMDKSKNCCPANHKLVLYQDHYDCNWVPICTNIVMVSTNRMKMFQDIINKGDLGSRFKVEDLGVVQRYE